MNLFLCILFPSCYLVLKYLTNKGRIFEKKSLYRFFLGISFGLLYSFVMLICVNKHRQISDLFVLNWLYLYCTELLIPIIVITLICLSLGRKSVVHKFRVMQSFSLGFYTIFFPYISFFLTEKLSFFGIFVKPILFIFVVISIMQSFIWFVKFNHERKPTVFKFLLIFITFLISIIPACVESLYFNKLLPILYCVLPIICVVYGIILLNNSEKISDDYLY